MVSSIKSLFFYEQFPSPLGILPCINIDLLVSYDEAMAGVWCTIGAQLVPTAYLN